MQRGVQFDALDGRHELRFDVNALCQMEADFGGLSIEAVARRLQPPSGSPSLTDLRAAFRAALGGDVTLQGAGDIMADIGMDKAAMLLGEALALAFPAAANQAAADPNRAARRAGKPRAAA